MSVDIKMMPSRVTQIADLRVLILDDDQDHAELLILALRKFDELNLQIKACFTTDDAWEALQRSSFDLIFVDYRLADTTGEKFIERLREAGIRTPVIGITAVGDQYAAAAITRAGAEQFLLKDDIQTSRLREAIDAAIESADEMREVNESQEKARALIERLTARESEILELIVEGKLSKQIAAELGCAEGTVKLHRSHMLEKTGANTTGELVRIAMQARGHVSGSS